MRKGSKRCFRLRFEPSTKLEYCSVSENVFHAYKTGLHAIPEGVTVLQSTIEGKVVKTHCSVNDAARSCGGDHSKGSVGSINISLMNLLRGDARTSDKSVTGVDQIRRDKPGRVV